MRFLGLALLAVACGGCDASPLHRACMGTTGGAPHPLVDGAAAFRLDVYGASAHCQAGQLASGAGAPIATHTYGRDQTLQLDIPPGRHALVLTSFADAAATMPLGQGCSESDFGPGTQICVDLTLSPAPDGGGVVVPGACNSAADCEQQHSGQPSCDDGVCHYTGCSTGWGDCRAAPPNLDGCETNLDTDVDHCGHCSRPCSSTNVDTRHCTGGSCDSTCSGNYSNCARPAAGDAPTADDGCEAPPHVNGIGPIAAGWGLGQSYASCRPLGVPGDPTTYDNAMTAAARAASTLSGTDNSGASCGSAQCLHRDGSNFCIVWCYSNDTSSGDLTAGHVHRNESKQCYCPDQTDPTWN